jgi:hypothetical protein
MTKVSFCVALALLAVAEMTKVYVPGPQFASWINQSIDFGIFRVASVWWVSRRRLEKLPAVWADDLAAFRLRKACRRYRVSAVGARHGEVIDGRRIHERTDARAGGCSWPEQAYNFPAKFVLTVIN